PEVSRHDAEHRAAIQAKLAIRDYFDAVIAKLHRASISYGFAPLGGVAGFPFGAGEAGGGPSRPGGNPCCCICCGGGGGTAKFSAIVMCPPWRFTISSIMFFSFSCSTASRA